MAVLSWGKPKLEISTDGTNWTEITVPIKQGTATLETEPGEKTEALDEGGETVDVRFGKSKYTFTFSLYAKKGATKPIADVDGQITTNYGIRLTPEDASVPGFIMRKANVSVHDTWSSADGGLWVYTFSAIKDGNNKMLDSYNGLSVSPNIMDFTSAADSTGKTATISGGTGTISAAASPAGWATPTIAGSTLTVKVSANNGSGATARTTVVTITDSDGNKTATVTVNQAA